MYYTICMAAFMEKWESTGEYENDRVHMLGSLVSPFHVEPESLSLSLSLSFIDAIHYSVS